MWQVTYTTNSNKLIILCSVLPCALRQLPENWQQDGTFKIKRTRMAKLYEV